MRKGKCLLFCLLLVLAAGCYRPVRSRLVEAIKAGDLDRVKDCVDTWDSKIDVLKIALDPDGLSPTEFAIQCEQPEIAIFFIERGAARYENAEKARSLVINAVFVPHSFELVQSLKSHGWDPNSDAAYCAALYGDLGIVRMYVDEGLDVNGVSIIGETLLGRACCSGSTEIIRYALAHGADPNGYDDFLGMYPLHALATYPATIPASDLPVDLTNEVQMLLAAGADPVLHDRYGRTPYEVAVEYHQNDLARLLQEYQ